VHFAGRPILATELGEHGAVSDADQNVFDAGWRQITAGWQALLAAPGERLTLRWRSGVGDDTHGGLALAAHKAALLIGNAGLRMRSHRLLHIEREENEWKGQSSAHAAILSGARKP
jgi:hypothetical protein